MRSQESEVRSQKSGVRSQESGVQKSGVRRRNFSPDSFAPCTLHPLAGG
ncbi:MAG: hypothetical protein PX483_03265 [Nostocales cyanobacterium LE14-WE4]|nr:hypothetical protein [Anabaena sp. 49633_E8]MCE2701941.1 hypothetical protein [Anabaena sp. 49633_E8]MDJ0499872.1 hypothetical protein [Nostocales cyanobacterium LE14-WE4]